MPSNRKSAWNDHGGAEFAKGEATLLIIKPDAVARGLMGEIIGRVERKGLEVVAMMMSRISEDEAKRLYVEHTDKPFFRRLVDFTTSGPSIIMIVRGNSAVSVVRAMMGETDCSAAAPGTIRGDFGISSFERTLVHGSKSSIDFDREWRIFGWGSSLYRTPYRVDRLAAYSGADE